MKNFRDLGIQGPVLETIEKEGWDDPSEIQERTIPLILKGRDVIAGSATGSGKTFAFGYGIINKISKGKGIKSIVLTPTRELAQQVSDEIAKFSKHKNLRITSIYGGVAIGPQMNKLKTTDIVVGTPGRVLDHIGRGTMDLSGVEVAVLDEADRMLDMGFIDDVRKILSYCSKDRQTLMYSATIQGELEKLAKDYMKNPETVIVESYVDPSKLDQVYYDVPNNKKLSLLIQLLKQENSDLVMVFCNTQRTTDFVARNLRKQGINATAIHGGFSQAKRTNTMEKFNQGNVNVLTCTDVAARGLHIEDVSHVYNYDIPKTSKDYIHRIGRTARAGSDGKAISILTEKDHGNFRRVLSDSQITIKNIQTPKLPSINVHTQKQHDNNNNKRGRGYKKGRRGKHSKGGRKRKSWNN